MSDLSKVPTRQLIYELYDRTDDNLYAPERKFDPYLDSIDRLEKQNLYQTLRLTLEDYKDVDSTTDSRNDDR
jgi:hypothetical protein